MTETTRTRPMSRTERTVLVAFPAVKLAVHLATLSGYGYFRDELYYLASTTHLTLGFVDHPPLSIAFLSLVTAVLGDSLAAVRLVPALAGAATVLLVGLTARRLGGGAFAQALGMTAVLAAPLYLGLHHVYSMNALDTLIWAGAAYALVPALERPTTGRWALLGLLLGLGLANKISVLWLGAGLAVALLATRKGRRLLATPGPWIAAGVALVLFSPYVVWNAVHGWPTLEFMANATGEKMIARPPVSFLVELTLAMNPLTLPVWLGGLVFLFAGGRTGSEEVGRGTLRILGWSAATVLAILLLAGSARTSYAAPAFTWLFAAGGPGIETGLARLVPAQRTLSHVLRGGILTVVAVAGALLAPLALPVLPVDDFVAYRHAVGIGPAPEERHEMGLLPQFFADMHGWEALVDEVERVVRRLPPEQRAKAVVYTQNYGEAGALDVLGRERGLPTVVSGHNSYWMWGPPEGAVEVIVVLGGDRASLEEAFARVERAGTVDCGYCMPYEDDLPIWIGRGLRGGLEEIWPTLKHYD